MRLKSLLLPSLAAAVVAILAVALASHSVRGSAPGPSVTSSAKAITVAIRNYAFKPPSLNVKAGTRITWTNHDSTAHTATADRGPFDTGTLNANQSKTVDFKKPGTYTYHCAFHAFMTGTVKVLP